MTHPRCILLFRLPIGPRDLSQYGGDALQQRGFDVAAWDLSELTGTAGRIVEGDDPRIVRVRDAAHLSSLVRSSAADAVFFDYVNGLRDIDWPTRGINAELTAQGARTAVVYGGAVPPPIGAPKGSAGAKFLAALSQPARVFSAVGARRVAQMRRRGVRYGLPWRVFAGDSAALTTFLGRTGLSRDAVRSIHSLDHDIYLGWKQGSGVARPGASCVFLDEGLTGHPDFGITSARPLDAARYERALSALFDRVEADLGLQVTVALHPRSPMVPGRAVFAGRPAERDRTLDLVAGASLVVAHSTTAISFAALLGVPVLVVLTQDMLGTFNEPQVRGVAAALGCEPVEIELAGGIDRAVDGDAWANAGTYGGYLDHYVRTPGLPERFTWDFVADELRSLGG